MPPGRGGGILEGAVDHRRLLVLALLAAVLVAALLAGWAWDDVAPLSS
jgi:hypothetical protein